MTPEDVTRKPDWDIYYDDASWPCAAGKTFIVRAAEAAAYNRFGLRGHDIADNEEPSSLRDVVARDFAELLMRGSLVAEAQPLDDERMVTVPAAEWTPTSAFDAVRRGYVLRRAGNRKRQPHWVFIGRREADLLDMVYGWSDMMIPPEDWDATHDLASTILGSLSAIARNPAAIAPQHSSQGVLRLLLPESDYALHRNDRTRLVEAMIPWLIAQFEADAGNRRTQDDFAAQAIAELAPYVTKRIFDEVWAEVRKRVKPRRSPSPRQAGSAPDDAPTRSAGPDLSAHGHYFRRGRRARDIVPAPAGRHGRAAAGSRGASGR